MKQINPANQEQILFLDEALMGSRCEMSTFQEYVRIFKRKVRGGHRDDLEVGNPPSAVKLQELGVFSFSGTLRGALMAVCGHPSVRASSSA